VFDRVQNMRNIMTSTWYWREFYAWQWRLCFSLSCSFPNYPN